MNASDKARKDKQHRDEIERILSASETNTYTQTPIAQMSIVYKAIFSLLFVCELEGETFFLLPLSLSLSFFSQSQSGGEGSPYTRCPRDAIMTLEQKQI